MNTIHSRHYRTVTACRYPNNASGKYFWACFADTIRCLICTISIVTILFFLIAMS